MNTLRCCCSFAKWCPTLCNPMDCSTPGLPVPHYLPEFAWVHVLWISDLIQPSHLLLPPSPFPSIFPSLRVFTNELAVWIRWPKYCSFSFSISLSNKYSGFMFFRIDWFDHLMSKGFSRVFSSTIIQKHRFFISIHPNSLNLSYIHIYMFFFFLRFFSLIGNYRVLWSS